MLPAFIVSYLSMFLPGLLSSSAVNSSSTPAPFPACFVFPGSTGSQVRLRPDHSTKFLHRKKRKQKRFVPEATTDTLAPATYSLGKYCQLHNRKQVSHPPCALALMRMRTSLLTKRSSLKMKVVHFQSTHLQRPPSPPRPPHGTHKQVAPMPSRTLLIPLQRVHTPPRMCLLPLPPFLQRAIRSSAFLAQELP